MSTVMAILYFVLIPLFPTITEYYFPEQAQIFEAKRMILLLHIFGGTTALATGAVNLRLGLRGERTSRHKLLGKIYALAVTVGSVAGGYMAFYSFGGRVAHVGFFVLALLWVTTLIFALYAIAVLHDERKHSFWMIINFSLTFAAVTLRLQVIPLGASSELFAKAYPIIAWTCWVPNLIIGTYLARRYQQTFAKK